LEGSKDDHCQENKDTNCDRRLLRTSETVELRLRHEPSEVVRHEHFLPRALPWQSAARRRMRDPSAYTFRQASGWRLRPHLILIRKTMGCREILPAAQRSCRSLDCSSLSGSPHGYVLLSAAILCSAAQKDRTP
jgi:hypothetical protein